MPANAESSLSHGSTHRQPCIPALKCPWACKFELHQSGRHPVRPAWKLQKNNNIGMTHTAAICLMLFVHLIAQNPSMTVHPWGFKDNPVEFIFVRSESTKYPAQWYFALLNHCDHLCCSTILYWLPYPTSMLCLAELVTVWSAILWPGSSNWLFFYSLSVSNRS